MAGLTVGKDPVAVSLSRAPDLKTPTAPANVGRQDHGRNPKGAGVAPDEPVPANPVLYELIVILYTN